MEDISQRRSKDGDVFIVLAGENSKHLRIGVQVNGSIFYYEEGRLGNGYVRNTYLIENPTEQELIVKEKIQKLLEEKENEKKRKNDLETISLDKLEVGGIYKDIQGKPYAYLGKRKVTFELFNHGNTKKTEKFGNCFVYMYGEDPTAEDALEASLEVITVFGFNRKRGEIDVLKGNKKLAEMIGKIDVKFPLIEIDEKEYVSGRVTKKIVIE